MRTMNEIQFTTLVFPEGKQFQWFVVSDCNNAVLAQGMARKQETAQRHATQAANDIIWGLSNA